MGLKGLFQRKFWQFSLFGIGLTLLLSCTVAVFVVGNQSQRAEAQAVNRSQVNALYLADPTRPLLDANALRGSAVRTVSAVNDLVSGAANVDAVIIDASVYDRVDQRFLGDQLRQGRYIVGINVPLQRLEQIPGYKGSAPEPPNGVSPSAYAQPGSRTIYSFVYKQSYPSGGYQRTYGSDYLWSVSAFLDRLSFNIGQRGRGCPPSCTTTPSVRP